MRVSKRTVFSKSVSSGEPDWDETRESLPNILNWYSYNKTQDDAKEYLLDYAKYLNFEKTDIKLLSGSKERVNTSIAWLSRLLLITLSADQDIKTKIVDELNRIISIEKTKTDSETKIDKKHTVNVQENIRAKLAEYLGEINFQLDIILESIRKNEQIEFSLKDWLRDNKVSAVQVKNISNYFKTHVICELLEAQAKTCEQLTEAYSFLSSSQLKKYIQVIQQFIDDSDEQHLVKKQMLIHNRTPRKVTKSPLKQVAKLKYLKEHNELKSIVPTKIVGAKAILLYNPESRVVTYYACDNNHGLGVKGSTLVNYELTQTMCKILRDPEKLLPKFISGGRVEIRNSIRDLNSKNREANGRINDKLLILRAF
jgi:hypothetical protein